MNEDIFDRVKYSASFPFQNPMLADKIAPHSFRGHDPDKVPRSEMQRTVPLRNRSSELISI